MTAPGAASVPTVETVLGPVPVDALGVTLTHEHILNDVTSWAHRTSSPGWDPEDLAHRPVSEDILWDLRQDPFANLDNCRLDDVEVAVAEVQRFADLGGGTIVEATGLGIGRDLEGLREVSRRTGVHVVAGTGFYLDGAQPDDVRGLPPQALAEIVLADVESGVGGIRPGIVGEIGVGADFTPAERASLQAACAVVLSTGLALEVHLPAWFRLGEDVLDVVEAAGVDPARVVLCHLGPSGDDLAYQERLLTRGARVQYDMIGMEVFYADQGVQCPSDEDNARWLTRLADRGHLDGLLVSQDVFLKSLLRRHGGPGYAHVLQYFVPRLRRHGWDDDAVDRLLVTNPRTLLTRA